MLKKDMVLVYLVFFLSGCSYQINSVSLNKPHENVFYDSIYFIGTGVGSNENKEIAYKIAKLKALGNLSENIEVEVLSILDYYVTEKNTEEIDETINKQIGIISSTKIRDPIYIVSEENNDGFKYHYKILAKKNRKDYIIETASDLNYNAAGEMLLEMFKKKFN